MLTQVDEAGNCIGDQLVGDQPTTTGKRLLQADLSLSRELASTTADAKADNW